jgi:hypothetical protein
MKKANENKKQLFHVSWTKVWPQRIENINKLSSCRVQASEATGSSHFTDERGISCIGPHNVVTAFCRWRYCRGAVK